jgi:hypothetical protein
LRASKPSISDEQTGVWVELGLGVGLGVWVEVGVPWYGVKVGVIVGVPAGTLSQ